MVLLIFDSKDEYFIKIIHESSKYKLLNGKEHSRRAAKKLWLNILSLMFEKELLII